MYIFRMFAILLSLVLASTAGAEDFFEIKPGKTFTFLGPQGQGKATTISLTNRYVIINSGTSDEVIGDLVGRDIIVQGPNGGPMSIKEMRGAFATTQAPSSGGMSSGSTGGDLDADLDALFEGMPAALKSQLKTQFAKVPRDDAMKAIKLIRGQMNLPPVDFSTAHVRPAKSAEAEVTGNTRTTHNGLVLREVMLAGDRIWVADASTVPDGAEFVAAMAEFSRLFAELSGGLLIQDASILRIGELDGGFPYIVEAASGDVFEYATSEPADVRVPRSN